MAQLCKKLDINTYFSALPCIPFFIPSKVKAIIVDKLSVNESEVTPEATFAQDLGADSLDTVELIMNFEKEFGITIPDDKAEGIKTVGDAIAYIENATK